MKEPKQGILSSFINYLKPIIQIFKKAPDPVIKKQNYSKAQFPHGRSKRGKETKLDLHRGEIIAALDKGETKASIARKYDTSSVNLHYWLKRRKIKISKKHSISP